MGSCPQPRSIESPRSSESTGAGVLPISLNYLRSPEVSSNVSSMFVLTTATVLKDYPLLNSRSLVPWFLSETLHQPGWRASSQDVPSAPNRDSAKDPSAMNSSKLTNCLHKIYPDPVSWLEFPELSWRFSSFPGGSVHCCWNKNLRHHVVKIGEPPLSALAMNFDYKRIKVYSRNLHKSPRSRAKSTAFSLISQN